MLGRIVAGAAKTGGTILVGVAVDRAANLRGARQTPAVDPTGGQQPGTSSGFLRTGNQCLADAQRKIAPKPESNIVRDAVKAQIDKRVSLVEKARVILSDPQAARENAQSGIANLKNDVDTLRGAAQIAAGNASLTPGEAATIAGAVAKDTATGAYGAAKAFVKGTYAAATTTEDGVRQLANAVTERAGHDALQAGAGVAISNTLATAVGAIPHPAAKIAAVGIRVTGNLAAGAKASEMMREVGGASDDASATMQAVGKALRSKVGEVGGDVKQPAKCESRSTWRSKTRS
jgi:hypothetical protein